MSSEPLPPEIEKACEALYLTGDRVKVCPPYAADLSRALLAEVDARSGREHDRVFGYVDRRLDAILSECERRYARRGEPFVTATEFVPPMKYKDIPIVADPSVPPGELRAASKDPVRATYGDQVADWIKSKLTTPDTASTIPPPPKEPTVEEIVRAQPPGGLWPPPPKEPEVEPAENVERLLDDLHSYTIGVTRESNPCRRAMTDIIVRLGAEFARRAARSSADDGWRPMSEAPKDGTRVLLMFHGDPRVAWFDKAKGRWVDNDYWWTVEPTAWHKLPAPPPAPVSRAARGVR